MNNKIVQGIYIQTVENKKVVQKYVSTEELKLANGKTLGEFLNTQNERIITLENKIKMLEHSFSTIIKSIGGINEEN